MTELEIFQAVNQTYRPEQLYDLVESITDRTEFEEYDMDNMLDSIDKFSTDPEYYAQFITRKFGIRQQAIALNFYNK